MRKLVTFATVAAMVLACSVQSLAYYGPTTAVTTQPYRPAAVGAANSTTAGGSPTSTTANAAASGAVSASTIDSAISRAMATVGTTADTLTVNMQNVDLLNANSMKSLAKRASVKATERNIPNVSLQFDQILGKSVLSRITIPATVATAINGNFSTEISTDGPTVDSVKRVLSRQFGADASVASMKQKGQLPGEIMVAIYFGSDKLPATPYAYVLVGNVMYQVPAYADDIGYVYISTQYAGEVVITGAPLV